MEREEDLKRMADWIEGIVAAGAGVRRDSDLFEDCVQEAWLAVLSLDSRRKHREAYRAQAAKWAALCFLNRELAEAYKGLPMPDYLENPEEVVIVEMERERGLKAMSRALNARESFVFLVSAYSPLSQKQIGDVMGLSTRQVRRLQGSARRKMSKLEAARRELVSAGSVAD